VTVIVEVLKETTSEDKRERCQGNGMRMSDKKYDQEMVEIAVQLEVLMEMLQRNEKDQKYGYVMRKKLKW